MWRRIKKTGFRPEDNGERKKKKERKKEKSASSNLHDRCIRYTIITTTTNNNNNNMRATAEEMENPSTRNILRVFFCPCIPGSEVTLGVKILGLVV